jgi:hypothetical protein
MSRPTGYKKAGRIWSLSPPITQLQKYFQFQVQVQVPIAHSCGILGKCGKENKPI